ncbi:hypothetical protein FQN52_006181 [Onygenales sp. PD_12]|nr:hypothetical protein FQN52_006181 [Onygenales sp. PD_12]
MRERRVETPPPPPSPSLPAPTPALAPPPSSPTESTKTTPNSGPDTDPDPDSNSSPGSTPPSTTPINATIHKYPPAYRRLAVTIVAVSLLLGIITPIAVVLPTSPTRRYGPAMPRLVLENFPDPGGLIAYNGTWYAFGTNPAMGDVDVRYHVPVARTVERVGNGNGNGTGEGKGGFFGKWEVVEGREALPDVAVWETRRDHWAPDVVRRPDGKFILYYTGELAVWSRHHCVGAAISTTTTDPVGPYIPEREFLACHLHHGGAIDPSPFIDTNGTPYVLYKGDGNSIGNGGNCNNEIPPLKSTPIFLQRLKDDYVTPAGLPVKILDREEEDGPLVEAPNVVRSSEGWYFLFFSSHCFDSRQYDVKYATSRELQGPYERAGRALLKTGDFGLKSPGGATVAQDGGRIAFHAGSPEERCMWVGKVELRGREVKFVPWR